MKLLRCYILDGHEVVCLGDDEQALLRQVEWRMANEGKCQLAHHVMGDVTVSTVFLGIDCRVWHAREDDPPVIFETMVFGGPHHHYQRRYATYDAAIDGHVETLAMIGETRH